MPVPDTFLKPFLLMLPALFLSQPMTAAPDSAPSYPTNPWEYPVPTRESGFTYYFPLDESMVGEKLEVVLLGLKGGGQELQPSVWRTARDLPFASSRKKIPH